MRLLAAALAMALVACGSSVHEKAASCQSVGCTYTSPECSALVVQYYNKYTAPRTCDQGTVTPCVAALPISLDQAIPACTYIAVNPTMAAELDALLATFTAKGCPTPPQPPCPAPPPASAVQCSATSQGNMCVIAR
ncbi:MAG TPA: hypothetical protein VFE30_15640 [Anaeromyxobacteraceae bacterium]|nr:hypothetical protein [Anaeromyxobacteraceae bacterium]